MLTNAPHYTPPTASEQQDLLALYQQFGCRNNDKVFKESLDLAVPQQVANASPKQQEPMDMMGLMFNFLQTMMNPSVQSQRPDDIPIDYRVRNGRLAGVARDLAGAAMSSGDAPLRGPPLLGQAGLRRLHTIDITDRNIGDEASDRKSQGSTAG